MLRQDGTVDEALMPGLSPDDIKRLYAHMVLTRQFDDRMFKLQRQGRLGTFARVAGQEGAHVGAAFALRPTDWLVPAFRETGALMWRGITMVQLLQLWGGDERGGRFPHDLRTLPVAIPVALPAPAATPAIAGRWTNPALRWSHSMAKPLMLPCSAPVTP